MIKDALVAACLVVLVACGSAESTVDPRIARVSGRYVLTSQEVFNGPIVSTIDVTHMDSDVYTLGDSTWSRAYSATSISPDGTRRPYSGTASGTFTRLLTQLTFRSAGKPNLVGYFSGSGLKIHEGDYVFTYARE